MKHSFFLASVLSAFALGACSDATPPPSAPASQVAKTESKTAQEPSTPAQPAAPAANKSAALAANDAAPEAPAKALDPSNARGRYQGGVEKLDTKQDVSKIKVADHDEHDGHDHGAEKAAAAAQDGSALLPDAQAQANKGRFTLTDGTPQVKDLGKMRQGDVGEFDFPFVSDGEEPLIITGVKPSCGCTKAEVALLADDGSKLPYTKGDPIPVGKKFVLESQINTDGRQGSFNAQISLYGNDIRGAFNVRLTAEIEPVLSITPSQNVFFGRITSKDVKEETVVVKTTRGEHFRLSLGQEVVQDPVKIALTAKEPDAEGKASEWDIKITFGPGSEIGMRNYPVNFQSDIPVSHPKYPSPDGTPQLHGFVMNVQAQVSGMVSAEPTFITFGMVRPNEPVERALRLEAHDDFKLTADIPVILEGLQGQEFPYKDNFKVTVEPIEGGKAANLKVKLTGLPADLNGSLGGVMRVKVGHPFMDEITVRFSAVCRPAVPTAPPAQPPVGGQTGGQ